MKLSYVIAGIVAVAAGVQVVGAKLISNRVEDGIKRTVHAYSEQSSFPFEVSDFESGWFTSHFTVRTPIPTAFIKPMMELGFAINTDGTSAYISTETDLTHGPIIVKNGIHFAAAYASGTQTLKLGSILDAAKKNAGTEEKQARLKAIEGHIGAIEKLLTTQYTIGVSYRGDVSLKAKVQGGKINIVDAPRSDAITQLDVSVDPIQYTWNLSSDANSSLIKFKSGTISLHLSGPDQKPLHLAISPMVVTSDISRLAPGYWDGTYTAEMDGVKLTVSDSHKGDVGFDTGPLSSTISVSVNPQNPALINGESALTLNGLNITRNGTPIELGDLKAATRIENILLALPEAQSKLSMEMWKKAAAPDPTDQFGSFDFAAYKELVQDQVDAKPYIDISNYSINLDGNEIATHGSLMLQDGLIASNINSLADIAPYIEGDLVIDIDSDYIHNIAVQSLALLPKPPTEEQLSERINTLALTYQSLGFIVKEGNHYIATFKVKDDQLFINGKPFMKVSDIFTKG
ncbi:DUF945 family protein [Kordiimonas pumila]|uniref:DUF945 family protein n=1 Tax=Kordiimonas pumila TaxID=2161677 RepID=A0ABV7D172_9PROT|nr:DUF945 family protein [Kordiimonas pumila]